MKLKILFLLALPLLAQAQSRTTVSDSIIVTLAGSSAADTVWIPYPTGNSTTPPAFMFNSVSAKQPGRTVDYISAANLYVTKTGTGTSFKVRNHPISPLSGALSKNDSTFIVGSSGAGANIVSGSNYSVTGAGGTHGFGLVLSKHDAGTAVLTITVEIAR